MESIKQTEKVVNSFVKEIVVQKEMFIKDISSFLQHFYHYSEDNSQHLSNGKYYKRLQIASGVKDEATKG